jgi:hypothetical protein
MKQTLQSRRAASRAMKAFIRIIREGIHEA